MEGLDPIGVAILACTAYAIGVAFTSHILDECTRLPPGDMFTIASVWPILLALAVVAVALALPCFLVWHFAYNAPRRLWRIARDL